LACISAQKVIWKATATTLPSTLPLTLCKWILIHLHIVATRVRHACCSAQPGHWLGPVTGSGWLSPAQPPKNKKLKKIESVEIEILHVLEKMYFNNLFTDIRIRNKKISWFFLAGIFTNVKVGSIQDQIFTSARFRNIINKSS